MSKHLLLQRDFPFLSSSVHSPTHSKSAFKGWGQIWEACRGLWGRRTNWERDKLEVPLGKQADVTVCCIFFSSRGWKKTYLIACWFVWQTGEEGYLEAFKNELEAFKSRVRFCSQSQNFQANPAQNPSFYPDFNCIGGLASFPQVSINFFIVNG